MPSLFSPDSFAALLAGWGLFFALTTVACVAAGFAWERSALGRRRRIYDVPLRRGQYGREAYANVRFVMLATGVFAAAVASGVVRAEARGAAPALLTFAACLIGFEAYYYAFHRAMHTRALVPFHRWHHDSHTTTPLSGQSLGAVEALGWIAGLLIVPALLSRAGALHAGGFVAYLLANGAANIIGHANAEVFPRKAGLRAKSWASHPFTYHAMHHARWTGHYGLGTTVMDRVMGTEWADWPALHARVLDGRPMRSLKERGEAERPEA